jgi:membrane protein YdbS with pleckstrin-like domain
MKTGTLVRPNNRLDPAVVKLWWLAGAIRVLVISAAAFVGNWFLDWPVVIPVTVSLVVAIGQGVLPPLLYRRWRYEIRNRDVFLSSGALIWRLTLIPFDRIQFVETQQGPLERWFRLSKVVVYTAAGRAASIPGLNVGEAERLREELSLVAGTESV